MDYAFEEIRRLLSTFTNPIDERSPNIRYVCALISEITYYHIPQFEIDDRKRTKIVPCDAYRKIINKGLPTDIVTFLKNELDSENSFVVYDRGIVAVGININNFLFIGFRGTSFLFDWKINLNSTLVPIYHRNNGNHPYFYETTSYGRVHKGFAEEALRISIKILEAVRDRGIGDKIDHVFLTGHSLGGAVAAIAENYLNIAPTSVCILGSPRYSDISAYYMLPYEIPTQIHRLGDIVPLVPPRSFGYADHPYAFNTNGMQIFTSLRNRSYRFKLWILALFFARRFEPHKMESYRSELGVTAGAIGSTLPLIPFKKLKRADLD
jgi:hypothetical protein